MMTIEDPSPPLTPLASTPAADRQFRPFGDDGFTFADFLDIINPLQHLPVVSTLYRRMTGDTLESGPRFLGGALFGGPLGAASALVNAIVEAESGKDVGEHVATALLGEADNPIAVAAAERFPVPAATLPAPDDVQTGLSPQAVETRALPDLAEVAASGAGPWTPMVELAALAEPQSAPEPGQAGSPTPLRASASRGIPAGATAEAGGWFTETMLSALRKYEEAVTAGQPRTATVQQTI